jgi:hypothetical protein
MKDIENIKKDNKRENQISKIIVDYRFKIYNKLGPGLLEFVYEKI